MSGRESYESNGDATCTDCGRGYINGPEQTGALCDDCCEDRDAHTSALEIRMARASLKETPGSFQETSGFLSEVPVVVDVALVPVDPAAAGPVVEVQLVPIAHPPGYLAWLDSLRANAHYGSDALAHAWYISPVIYHQRLIEQAPDLWLTLKAIARRVA